MDSKMKRFFDHINGKKVTVCGVGVSNGPLVEMFINKGAIVTICDRKTKEQLGELGEKFEKMGATLCLGDNYLDNLDADFIFRTPGMRFNMPQLEEARKKGSAVLSEMEVFFEICPCPIYAVTGSDGKTTTTTIISELLKASGKTVHLGGNIGRALLPLVEEISDDDVAVVELSSFQLISMRASGDVSVVTNVSPNHLDVHKDMQEYIDAKKNVFAHQSGMSRTVLNLDNEITKSFQNETRGETLFFSRRAVPQNGAYMDDKGDIYFNKNGESTFIMNESEIRIPGMHNRENYIAAISATWGAVSIDTIKKVAKEFSGVEHRAEFVREVDGISFYNDSIATSPTRLMSGTLSLYNFKIVLIAGGYDKKIPFDSMGPVVCDKVSTIVLMGNTAPKIEAAIKNAPNYSEGNPVILHANTMEEAVEIAKANAKKGDIVSLCPACASFDKYPNFEARGNHYKDIVKGL